MKRKKRKTSFFVSFFSSLYLSLEVKFIYLDSKVIHTISFNLPLPPLEVFRREKREEGRGGEEEKLEKKKQTKKSNQTRTEKSPETHSFRTHLSTL